MCATEHSLKTRDRGEPRWSRRQGSIVGRWSSQQQQLVSEGRDLPVRLSAAAADYTRPPAPQVGDGNGDRGDGGVASVPSVPSVQRQSIQRQSIQRKSIQPQPGAYAHAHGKRHVRSRGARAAQQQLDLAWAGAVYSRGDDGGAVRETGNTQGSGARVGAREQGPGARVQGPGFRGQGPGARGQGQGTGVRGRGRGQGPGATCASPSPSHCRSRHRQWSHRPRR